VRTTSTFPSAGAAAWVGSAVGAEVSVAAGAAVAGTSVAGAAVASGAAVWLATVGVAALEQLARSMLNSTTIVTINVLFCFIFSPMR